MLRFLFASYMLIVFSSAVYGQIPQLVINEVMASNAATISDEDGDYEDWIELFNDSSVPINLEGYQLSDNPGHPQKWTFPNINIGPNEYLLVFASGKNRVEGLHLHTNFKISINGEPILLSNPEGEIVDYLPNVVLYSDHSFGRIPDGETEMILFSESTPGISNMTGSVYIPLNDVISFSAEQGFYDSGFDLHLTNLNAEANIYYTLNGSDPDTSSLLYEGAIDISDISHKPNGISTIPTNAPGTYGNAGWIPPADTVFKGTVIKARSFQNGQPMSPVFTHSYFVHPTIHTRYNNLPVVSIITDSLHLFGYESGIYVPGIHHDTIPTPAYVWRFGNYTQRGKEWERPAHITFFEGDGTPGFSQNIGLRIHGGGTRLFPLRALRIYARNEYGKNSIEYPVFPWMEQQEYKRLLLRPSGNDWRLNFCADGLSSLLIENMNIQKQEYRPAVVFINGEFWGLHNIRERIDKHFLEYKGGADPDELDAIRNWSEAVEGSLAEYDNLVEYINSHDLIYNPYYEFVSSVVDIDNLIDYFIARQYTAVKDWPGNNNLFWRSTGSDDLFKWIFFDNDKSLNDPEYNSIEHSLNEGDYPNWLHNETHVFLFKNLFRNHSFREAYKNQFIYHLENSFNPERVHQLLDSIVGMIGPVMPEHIARWQYPESYEFWMNQIEMIRDFADHRRCHMISHLSNQMNIDPSEIPFGVCDSLARKATNPNIYDAVKMWPNPTTGYLNVELDRQDHSIHSIRIADVSGRSVVQYVPHPTQNEKFFEFNLRSLNQGTYIVIIQTDQDVFRGLVEVIPNN